MDLLQVNKKLVVINISGTGVAMPWKNQAWYLGSETGNVWASILMGDVSPSGKLPYTYYAGLDQCGAHRVDEYPGHKGVDALGNEVYDIPYNEGLFGWFLMRLMILHKGLITFRPSVLVSVR